MNKPVWENLIYAIDTTGPFCTVALLLVGGDEIKVISRTSKEKISHVSEILVLTDELLRSEGMEVNQVTEIAVSVGPGSYTGIRAGLSTARALAQVLDIKVLPVSALEPFAFSREVGVVVCPIFNARRKQIYGGAYFGKMGRLNWEDEDTLLDGKPYLINEFLEELENKLEGHSKETEFREVVFLGDGVDAYEEELLKFKAKIVAKDIEITWPEEGRYQNAEFVAMRGYIDILTGGGGSYREALPDYMRKVEAEQKLEEKKEKIRAGVSFRRAVLSDVVDILEIENKCFSDPWTQWMIEDEIENAIYIVGEYEGRIISYGGIFIAGGDGDVHNFAVDPTFMNGSIGYLMGERLIKEAFEVCGKPIDITLEVREGNKAGIRLYEKLGFESVGVRPKYYMDGENAVIMWRYDNGSQ